MIFDPNYFLDLLKYQDDQPLLFTQLYFWSFFGFVMLGYSFVYRQRALRNAFLFGVSLFFYYKTSGFFFFILLFSICVDFYIGKWIYSSKRALLRKVLVGVSVAINLLVLSYFKYAYFFAAFLHQLTGIEIEVVNHFALWSNEAIGTDFTFQRILLPVGISFFTFQTISYTVDIYRGHVQPIKNLLDFGFYVSFFPQLVAGPIVRASDFVPQIYKSYDITSEEKGIALFWILKGLSKKMILADYLAVQFIDRVFDNPFLFSGVETMSALFGYSLQVYADFSGYTDVAIGISLLLGFRLPKNFDAPYKATSVADFWRRWHISLSSWLRDYLYIPLGGNRSGGIGTYAIFGMMMVLLMLIIQDWEWALIIVGICIVLWTLTYFWSALRSFFNTNINLMITMLLGGLWHGASWNFVTWGGLNGIGLVFYKSWKKVSPWANKKKTVNRVIGVSLTLIFITFTRAWFRASNWDNAIGMLNQIVNNFQVENAASIFQANWKFYMVLVFGFAIHWLPEKIEISLTKSFSNAHVSVQLVSSLLVIFMIYQSLSADLQPFIYFAF